MAITISGTDITFNDATTQNTAATGFAATTAMLFVQTSAPTGWTKSATHDNKALRVVTGTASSGGSVAFTTAFASGLSSNGYTLATADIPAHSHTFNNTPRAYLCGGSGGNWTFGISGGGTLLSNNNTGGGGSHSHGLPSFAVQYVDVIIATKN